MSNAFANIFCLCVLVYRFLSDIIGKGGANIKSMQEKLQVKISIPPASKEEKSNIKIGVCGMKDNVIKTKALMKELMMYRHTAITHPGCEHIEMDIPTHYYNHIIGAKGSEIKHIQGNFKVNVYVPNADSALQTVLVVGPPANIEATRKYILKLIETREQGRREATEMNKQWAGVTDPNDPNGPDVPEGSAVGAAGAEGSSPKVWIEDLLINAKRIPSSGAAPVASEVGSSENVPTAGSTTTGWGSSILTSNEGW